MRLKNRFKGIKLKLAALCMVAAVASNTTNIFAGDINDAEQSVINYYSGTFEYDGKTYVATEAAKSTAYAKLAQDGVDLTPSQARTAIKTLSLNVKKGIDSGYLVEVGGSETPTEPEGQETTNTGETENPEGETKSEETGNPEDDTKSEETGKTGEETKSGETGNPGEETKPEETGNSGEETKPGETGNPGEETKPGETGKPEGETKPGETGKPGEETKSGETTKENDEKETTSRHDADIDGASDEKETLSVEEIFKWTVEDTATGDATVYDNDDNDGNFTIENYKNGQAIALDANGQVIMKAGLPFKNTGLTDGGEGRAFLVIGICVGITLLIGIFTIIKKKTYKTKALLYTAVPVGMSLLMAIIYFAAFRTFAKNETDEWKSVWISGAPEYSYINYVEHGKDAGQSKPEDIATPVYGVQYGEVLCEKVKLQAPLYFGDSEEQFELGAGTYTGASVPGKGEITLIGAHDTTFFAGLENITKDDEITIKTIYGKYRYKVTETKIIDVKNDWNIKLNSDSEQIILYTCYPFGKTDEERSQRYLVYAELEK